MPAETRSQPHRPIHGVAALQWVGRCAAVCAAVLVALGAVFAAASLALARPNTMDLDATTASTLKADYSADDRSIVLPPLDPAIIAAAASDEALLPSPRAGDRAAAPASAIETPATNADGTVLPGGDEDDADDDQPPEATPRPGETVRPKSTSTLAPGTAVPAPTDRPAATATPNRCLLGVNDVVCLPTLGPKPTNTPKPVNTTPAPTITPRPPTSTPTPRPTDTPVPSPTRTSTPTKKATKTPKPATSVPAPSPTEDFCLDLILLPICL